VSGGWGVGLQKSGSMGSFEQIVRLLSSGLHMFVLSSSVFCCNLPLVRCMQQGEEAEEISLHVAVFSQFLPSRSPEIISNNAYNFHMHSESPRKRRITGKEVQGGGRNTLVTRQGIRYH